MVNYCCVKGCGRSSKSSPHLNYYTIPKDKNRPSIEEVFGLYNIVEEFSYYFIALCYSRLEWLAAAGREDLFKKPNPRSTYRFCSRHFSVDCLKNRNLVPNSSPTLCLPTEFTDNNSKETIPHHDIICDNCKNTILGFRYKCVTCTDYDLCPKCEMLEIHAHHYILRIPKPLKFKIADDLINKWRAFFKAEHVNPDCNMDDDSDTSGCSSDDEPISKHLERINDGTDIADDVKAVIREEVKRVLALKPDGSDDKRKRKKDKRKGVPLLYTALVNKTNVKKARMETPSIEPDSVEVEVPATTPCVEPAPQSHQVAFADVNAYKDQDVKNEVVSATSTSEGEESVFGQPMMNMRLSEDLTELMIEMANSRDKTVYKYN